MKKFLALVAVLGLVLICTASADAQVQRPRGGGNFGQAVARGVGFGLGQRLGLGFGGGFGLNRFGLGLNQFGYGGYGQFRQRAFIQPLYSPVVSVVQPVQAYTQAVIAQPVIQSLETDCISACAPQAILGSACGHGAPLILRQRAFGHYGARAFLGGGLYGGRFGSPLIRPRLLVR